MIRKSLLLTTAAVLASVSLAAGATFALFSDTTQQTENTFTAGRLCIDAQRNTGDTVPGPMFYMTGAPVAPGDKPGRFPVSVFNPGYSPADFVPEAPGGWAPGDSITRTMTVFNGTATCHSMAAKLTRVSAELKEGSYAALAGKMKVTVYAEAWDGLKQVAQGYLTEFLTPEGVVIKYPSGIHPQLLGYEVGDTERPNLHMKFNVAFDHDTPDDYQGQTMVVHFKIHAEQARNNP